MINQFNCPTCGCEKKDDKNIEMKSNWGNHIVSLKGVPAIICNKCNEVFYTSTIARLTQKVTKVFSENSRLSIIEKINISEMICLAKNSEEQDKIVNALANNIIVPKKIGQEYRITRTDALQAINGDNNYQHFDLAARDGKIDHSDLEKIKNDIEKENGYDQE